MTIKERNAVIGETFLGWEDHGIPTFNLRLDYSGSCQGFGGYDLRLPVYAEKMLWRVMKTLGVNSWEDLPGTHCRARCEQDKIHEIGHIIEDKWFKPEDLTRDIT